MAGSKQLKKRFNKIVSYRQAFSTPQGREVLLDLMQAHSVFDSTFDINTNEMCRKEGERNAVLRIMTILKISPSEMQALAEEIEKNARDNTSHADDPDNGSAPRIQW